MDDKNNNPNKNLPIQKVLISGATLSSLINTLNTSTSTTTGTLHGHLSLHTPPLSDDTPPPPSLIATITSTTPSNRHPIIGHFSTRRLSPLRPSLLDHRHSHSHPIFLLLTTSPSTTPTHSYTYRAYYFNPDTVSYETVSLEIVNIGPVFRGQYGSFSVKSGLPWLPSVGGVGSPMREDGCGKSLSEMKRVGNDVKELRGYVDDKYDIGNLFKLVGNDAVGYMNGVEDLYENMLGKLNDLAKVVEGSSSKLLDLENHNMKLRRRVAGIE